MQATEAYDQQQAEIHRLRETVLAQQQQQLAHEITPQQQLALSISMQPPQLAFPAGPATSTAGHFYPTALELLPELAVSPHQARPPIDDTPSSVSHLASPGRPTEEDHEDGEWTADGDWAVSPISQRRRRRPLNAAGVFNPAPGR